MIFEWDDLKNRLNIRKHGVSFEDALKIFSLPTTTSFDDQHSDFEDRYTAMGFLGTKLLVVNFLQREEDTVRIISARKATRREERLYEHSK
jgi:uncharacterized DUF497 family protein